MSDTDETKMVPILDMTTVGKIANQVAIAHALETYHEGLGDETTRRQKADLRLFTSFLRDHIGVHPGDFYSDLLAWKDITFGIVEGFQGWQKQEGYALGSINVRIATIKAYCKLAHDAELLDTKEYIRIRGIETYKGKRATHVDEKREQTRRPEAKKAEWVLVSRADMARLKDMHGSTSLRAKRDRLLICLLCDLGLRIGEVALLRAVDIDIQTAVLRCERPKVGKTGKDAQIHDLSKPEAKDTLQAAREYLPCVLKGQVLLFNGLSTRALRERVRVLGKRIDIANLSPHDCRHSWSTWAARSGTDILSLQDAGGWASIEMPAKYIARNTIANKGVKIQE